MTQYDDRALTEAWNEEFAPDTTQAPGRRGLLRGRAPRSRSVALATGIAVIGITGVVDAATGGNLREGVRNGTTTSETEIVSNIAASDALKGGYSTRQSNLSSSGGGAIYGCRSTAGGSAAKPPKNPCVRANNLADGFAFEFNATRGESAGSITVGSGGDTKRPFTTNATGVATGLNADRVDGASAADIVAASRVTSGLDADKVDGAEAADLKTRWLLLNEKGEIEDQSGGFKVIDAYGTNANVYIDAGSSLKGKGLTATIAAQNLVDVDGAAGADPTFDGQVSVSRCQIPNVVECAPAGAKTENALVVAPRTATGGDTTATDRRRVYITVTE